MSYYSYLLEIKKDDLIKEFRYCSIEELLYLRNVVDELINNKIFSKIDYISNRGCVLGDTDEIY